MKRFESFLAQPMEEYIVYRQNLGRTTTISHLRTFDRYLNENQPDAIILLPSFFLELRATLTQSSSTINGIFSELRSFFKFMVRRGYYTENPLQDVPSLTEKYFIPFVFSPEQTDNLL